MKPLEQTKFNQIENEIERSNLFLLASPKIGTGIAFHNESLKTCKCRKYCKSHCAIETLLDFVVQLKEWLYSSRYCHQSSNETVYFVVICTKCTWMQLYAKWLHWPLKCYLLICSTKTRSYKFDCVAGVFYLIQNFVSDIKWFGVWFIILPWCWYRQFNGTCT